jgi:hypothetical protein
LNLKRLALAALLLFSMNPANSTLTSVGDIYAPAPWPGMAGIFSSGSLTIDASAEKVALVFPVPYTGNIRYIDFNLSTVTTGDTLYGVITTVDTSGNCTTTGYGGMSTGTVAIANGATGAHQIQLASDASATKGDIVCAVIGFDSFVAGNMVVRMLQSANGTRVGLPYVNHFTASWSKQSGVYGCIGIGYSDGSYHYIANTAPANNGDPLTYNGSYSSSSTPDEKALKFKFAVGVSVKGVLIDMVGPASSAGAYEVKLYDSDGTAVLSTTTITGILGSGATGWTQVHFSDSFTLTADTYYRVSVEPTTANALTVAVWKSSAAAQMDQISGGQNFHYSSRSDDGSWTDDTTGRPAISLIVDQIHDGSGGAGGGNFGFVQ